MKTKTLSTILTAGLFVSVIGTSASAAKLHNGVPKKIHSSWISTKAYSSGPRINERYKISFNSPSEIRYDFPGESSPGQVANLKYQSLGKNKYKVVGLIVGQGGMKSGKKDTFHFKFLSKDKVKVSFKSGSGYPSPWTTTMKRVK
ncbi:hypothetical protein [Lactobacillus sp. Sy-1]|uniref:hypothetical protein n=1 Tax=Lactobacillus sp. Sy-1 TaxID=2109645 RepID=UPI001C5B9E43|nr:hypothetical protein [Lactobacillus sp. Sy-1]MBW1606078.1 hypothetical protein [Lactobacillus sp. Sy-1]